MEKLQEWIYREREKKKSIPTWSGNALLQSRRDMFKFRGNIQSDLHLPEYKPLLVFTETAEHDKKCQM